MTSIVEKRSYPAPPIDRREILRYAGVNQASPEVEALMEECLCELAPKLRYDVCFCELPLAIHSTEIRLGGIAVSSADLAKNLRGCTRAILFAATVGIAPDRLILRYNRLSPARALFVQAIGAERIESLCDVLNGEVSAHYARKGARTRPRFSPGYGDLSLAVQKDIFSVLDCARKIGLTLNDSLLMTPTKSVTAIIGIQQENI